MIQWLGEISRSIEQEKVWTMEEVYQRTSARENSDFIKRSLGPTKISVRKGKINSNKKQLQFFITFNKIQL